MLDIDVTPDVLKNCIKLIEAGVSADGLSMVLKAFS